MVIIIKQMDIIKELLAGNKISLARAITKIENDDGASLLESIFPHTGNAYQIGITGPPGAGKSTLVDKLASKFLDDNKKVGIIAVDPTSPFSGGALLGDRIRMSDLTPREGVFIRSMASRGSLGGLATTTKDVLLAFDAFGMDYIITETIGVGQVELDIASVCDTTVVVLVPESGDSIQAMKAGLLEIADIIVVNKGDREGADRILTELEFITDLRGKQRTWSYPILKTVATEDKGVIELLEAISSHREYLNTSGNLESQRKERIKSRIKELLNQKIMECMEKDVLKEGELNDLVEKVYRKELNLYQLIDRLIKKAVSS